MKNRLDYREFLEVDNTRKRLRKLLLDDRISSEFRHDLNRRLEDTEDASRRLHNRAWIIRRSIPITNRWPPYKPPVAKHEPRPGLLSRAVSQVKNFFRRSPK